MDQTDHAGTENSATGSVKRRLPRFVLLLGVLAIVSVGLALLQMKPSAPEKVYTIGIMRYLKALEKVEEGFYRGMENLGYIEGKNVKYIITEYGESPQVMQGIAQQLIDQDVDLIMAITNVAATGAKQATESAGRTDIPVVFTNANKPDATGLIGNYKSSGNNLTGVAVNFVEITAKKLEFLKRIDPNLKRIGAFDAVNSDPAGKLVMEELKIAAPKFGVEIVSYKVQKNVGPQATAELTAISQNIRSGDIDAYFHVPGPVLNPQSNVKVIMDLVNRLQIPAAFQNSGQVEQGGLLAYDPNLLIEGEQTAFLVDKIIKGQKPTDIPIEFPRKNNLSVNLAAARAAGITIPESILIIADTKIDK